jgi:hypothetical protein
VSFYGVVASWNFSWKCSSRGRGHPYAGHRERIDGPAEHFPALNKFHDLHKSGKLESPATVATYLHWLLSEIKDDEFGAEEKDIRLSKDDPRWESYLDNQQMVE